MAKLRNISYRRLESIRPSPENDQLYKPVDPADTEIVALSESIAQNGVLVPIIITTDGWIISGHRRYAAARLAGVKTLPCQIKAISRLTDPDGYLTLLRECNRQREKSLDEKLREEIVSADPDEAHALLRAHRRRNSGIPGFCQELEMGDQKDRCRISAAKQPMLRAAQTIIESLRDFWPLSVRQVHYQLLNNPPLRHASKPDSVYQNDGPCYDDLADLLTRARLAEQVPWTAIHDETRSTELWHTFSDPQPFFRSELDRLCKYYFRNLQQSQPHYIEIVAEKLTVKGVVEPIAEEYCIPVTIARGYCSIMPRYELAERFRKSGRDRLVILIVSDFDPDGESIAESLSRSLRDDFNIDSITPIKAALTFDQVGELGLIPQMKAKVKSSAYKKFVERYGEDTFELEAVEPEQLQAMLRRTIDSVIDTAAFDHELEQEKLDAAYLQNLRSRVIRKIEECTLEQ